MPGFFDIFRSNNTSPTPAASPAQPSTDNTTTSTSGTDASNVTLNSATISHADTISHAVPTAAVGSVKPAEQQAVTQLRSLVKTNQLTSYYEAAIGMKGSPELKEKAIALFEALPKINATTSADELVRLGLWSTKPRGIAAMQKTARYLPGRPVMVETTVNNDLYDGARFLEYKEGGQKAITHRATIAGEKNGNFLVKVDGKAEPIEVTKEEMFRLNQPNDFEHPGNPDKMIYGLRRHGLSRIVDYNDKFMKAKVCEAAIKMDSLVGELDFTKTSTGGNGGMLSGMIARIGSGSKMVDIQRKCVKIIHDTVNMTYPSHSGHGDGPGRDERETNAGRSAVRGTGVCDAQASVMLGILHPFQDKLGVDAKIYYGNCYRYKKQGDDPFSRTNSNGKNTSHSWMQLDYRPSMERRVCDRTWMQADLSADRAYSRGGDRYPMRDWFRPKLIKGNPDTDINLSGDVTIETVARQFGVLGQDGRDNHQ